MKQNNIQTEKKIAENLFFTILCQGFFRSLPKQPIFFSEITEQLDNFEKLKQAFIFGPKYNIYQQPKKNGNGYRKICAPSKDIKALQKIFLKQFLYPKVCNRLSSITRQKGDENSDFFKGIHGFIKKRSVITNAMQHQQQPNGEKAKYIVRIDFKNAFDSVKEIDIHNLFVDLILDEIRRYQKIPIQTELLHKLWEKKYPSRKLTWKIIMRIIYSNILFPVKHFSDFREDLKTWDDKKINIVVNHFADLIVKLVTYNGSIPQGAPTSPILLNLIIAKSEILEKIRNLLFFEGYQGYEATVTIYADDITISTYRKIPSEVLDKIYKLIQQKTPFTVHPDKTLFFNRRSRDPLITGVKLRKDDTLTLPKVTQKKIRGLIHHATINDVDEKIHRRIRGYILWVNSIYGKNNLPKQIGIPYQKYLKKHHM